MIVMVKVMATKEMIKCSNLENKKEKTKNQGDQGKCIKYVFVLVIKTL
jgi:hypothetical protein